MKIVSLKPNYIDGVLKLEEECFAHPWNREGIEEHFNNPNSYFFVAIDESENVLGYIGSYMVMDECFITNVAVTKNARGQGIGNSLVEKVCMNAKANGGSFVTLEVRMSNLAAISIYKKNDFISEGVRANFYRDPDEDALIMTRRF